MTIYKIFRASFFITSFYFCQKFWIFWRIEKSVVCNWAIDRPKFLNLRLRKTYLSPRNIPRTQILEMNYERFTDDLRILFKTTFNHNWPKLGFKKWLWDSQNDYLRKNIYFQDLFLKLSFKPSLIYLIYH